MQFIIEKIKRFVINAENSAEALKMAERHDDKNSMPYYEILGVLGNDERGETFDEG